MSKDLPQQPVADAPPQGQQQVEKPPTPQEVAKDVETKAGASMQAEVTNLRAAGNGGNALDASQEQAGATTAALDSMTPAEMERQGITVRDGVRYQNGVALEGPNRGKPVGESHPENPALAAADGRTVLNMDYQPAVPLADTLAQQQRQDTNGDGIPDLPPEPQPTPPAETLVEGNPANPTTGEVPRVGEGATLTANANMTPGQPGDPQQTEGLAPTQDETYRVAGDTTPVLPAVGSQARSLSAEVNATQDRSAPGGANTVALGAAGPAPGAPTLARTGPAPAPEVSTTPTAPAPREVAAIATPAAPTDATPTAAESNLERTPAQRAEAATQALEQHFANTPHAQQVRDNLAEFNRRTDVTPEQKAQALENLLATSRGQHIEGNGSRSNMSQENIDRAVAGGINDIAKPRNIDQGNNGTCNTTVIQEGVATENPERYTASLREAALHGTYTGSDGFKARIPSDLMTPHNEAMGAQNADGARNFSSQLLQGGMLNHYWQQRGQYYTDTDARGEQRYAFDASQNNADAIGGGANPFTTQWIGEGANVGANEVGNMGRNFGIQGQFVYAQRDWVTGPVDPSVRIVESGADLQRAKDDRAARYGSNWGIAVVHSGNSLFTGTEGLGGAGGGHVVSTYRNGDLSNQWGGQFDRTGVSNNTLFAAMSMNPGASSGEGPQGRGRPAGQFDDATLPQRFEEHRKTNPKAHGEDIVKNTPEDNKTREKLEDKKEEPKKEGKADETDQSKLQRDAAMKNMLNQRMQDLQRRIAMAQSQLDGGLDRQVTLNMYQSEFDVLRSQYTA
jgi:hypothetical protein